MAEKRITEFITGSDYGPALSLEDAGLAVMINRDDGTVVFFEGEGEGRASGVCLPGNFVKELSTEERPNPGTIVSLIYTSPGDEERKSYRLGVTQYSQDAKDWVGFVNEMLHKRGT